MSDEYVDDGIRYDENDEEYYISPSTNTDDPYYHILHIIAGN